MEAQIRYRGNTYFLKMGLDLSSENAGQHLWSLTNNTGRVEAVGSYLRGVKTTFGGCVPEDLVGWLDVNLAVLAGAWGR
jgi:hypothetical protein